MQIHASILGQTAVGINQLTISARLDSRPNSRLIQNRNLIASVYTKSDTFNDQLQLRPIIVSSPYAIVGILNDANIGAETCKIYVEFGSTRTSRNAPINLKIARNNIDNVIRYTTLSHSPSLSHVLLQVRLTFQWREIKSCTATNQAETCRTIYIINRLVRSGVYSAASFSFIEKKVSA
jgi:hypothetical protein